MYNSKHLFRLRRRSSAPTNNNNKIISLVIMIGLHFSAYAIFAAVAVFGILCCKGGESMKALYGSYMKTYYYVELV